MAWLDDYLAEQKGRQQVKQAGAAHSSFLGGFISSGVSSVGEMFGMDPFPTAETFRNEHPYAGLASELVGGVVPYVGWEGMIAKVPAIAKGLEAATAATKIDRFASPIKYGAAQLAIRFAPVEIARLGTGLVTTDDWSKYQGLMADVGLSTLLTGGIGGLGGFIRSGGSVEKMLSGRVTQAPIGWAAPYELRLSRSPTATVIGNAPMEQVQQDLMRETFLERPVTGGTGGTPKRGQVVSALEGVDASGLKRAPAITALEGVENGPKAAVQLSTLFNESKAKSPKGLIRQRLMQDDGTWTMGEDGNKNLLGAFGMESMMDLAESGRFPTIVSVGSDSAAGTMRRAVEGLSPVADGVLMGREAGDGLFIVGKRIRAGSGDLLTGDDGKPLRLFHGTAEPFDGMPSSSKNRIPQGLTVYSTDPEVASRYAKQGLQDNGKDAARVFPVVAKADGIADFRKAADLKKARDWFVAEADRTGIPFSEDLLKNGDYSYWENGEMLKANGWKGAFVSEIKKGGGSELNVAIDSSLAKSMFEQSAINKGDQWFFIKTDQPQRFAPQTSKSAELTFNQFAKFREPFDPARATPDFFNTGQNQLLQTMTPADFRDVISGRMNKQAFRAKVAENIRKTGGEKLGLEGSEMLNRWADKAYDVAVPTMFKETRNPLFGRLFTMLRLNISEGESFVNKMLGGAVKVRGAPFGKNVTHAEEFAPGISTLTSAIERYKPTREDIQTIFHVGMSQAPEETMAELTKDGLLSPAAKGMLDTISNLDKSFWEHMLPVAKNIGVDGKFSLLKGPYVPKLYKGDTFLRVEDGSGKLAFLANGKSLAEAQHQAKLFIEEASKLGLSLKEGRMFGLHSGELDTLHQQFEAALFNDPKIADVAKATAKRQAVENAGIRPGLIRQPMSASLTHERGDVLGAPDRANYSVKDLTNSVRQHYTQIAKNLGYESWRQRWLPEAFRLKGDSRFYFGAADVNKTLFEDLSRRARMALGYEGPQAKFLNKTLAPVLGPALGNKAATTIARGANQLLYAWNIGIMNPTFALVNLLTPLQTVAPWIALMKNAPEQAERLMHTHLRYGPDGKPAGVFNSVSIPKVLGQTMREMGKPDAVLMEHYGRAKTDGSLTPQLYEFAVGEHGVAAKGIRGAYENAGGGVAGAWEAMKSGATYMSRHTEEWSRLYAFTAGHIVGRDMFGLSGEALYRFAQRATHVSMYGYHAMDRSLMFTGPIGSMFGLFKNWQMHFIGQMMEYAGLAWRGETWAPLMWQFAGSLAIGGVGATPLVLAANSLARWNSDQPNSWLWMKEHWPNAADEIYFGLPALAGISLQASSTLPGTDVRNDIGTLANFVFLERAKAAWKATSAAYQYAEENGRNPLKDPNIRDGLLQAYAPRAFFRAFAATEGDYIKSMSTGYPQVRGVSPVARMAYTAGLNPVVVEEYQHVAQALWKDQQAQKQAIHAAGQRFAAAELNGDTEEMERVVERSIAQGLPMTSVAKSAQTIVRREKQSDLLSKYDKGSQAMVRTILGE
jgi:hypothetical protein